MVPPEIRDKRGMKQCSGLGWLKQAFHLVAWEVLNATLGKKGQVYRQWVRKQSFCGIQAMVFN